AGNSGGIRPGRRLVFRGGYDVEAMDDLARVAVIDVASTLGDGGDCVVGLYSMSHSATSHDVR
ncbi:MAG: hypothetical protein ABI533_02410, partial [Betaproteobacteria bacterium]